MILTNKYIDAYIAEIGYNQQKFIKSMEHVYNEINLATAKFSVMMTEWEKTTNKFITLMLEIGWPPPVELMPHQMEIIIQVYESDKSAGIIDEIEKILVHNYDTENLIKKLNKWKANLLLKNRHEILEEIIEAHLNKKYWLSVPAMLPQIEGIIAKGFKHFGKMYQTKLMNHIDRLLKENYPNLQIYPLLKKFILQYMLVDFKHGETINSTISRHAILHGADTKYGTASNSLKSILCFDFIQNSFRFVSLKHSNIFHLVGCPVGYSPRSNNKLDFYKYYFQANNAGKRPCKICKPKEYI